MILCHETATTPGTKIWYDLHEEALLFIKSYHGVEHAIFLCDWTWENMYKEIKNMKFCDNKRIDYLSSMMHKIMDIKMILKSQLAKETQVEEIR